MEKAIAVENLHFSYPDGRQALKGVSMTVWVGESVGIIGPNGAGKSTLLLHLNGIYRGQGRVEVLGLPVSDGNIKTIRSKVGLVFQNPDDQLFSPTVFDDVAFGPLSMRLPEDEVRRRVSHALDAVGMAGYGERVPHHLSIGEKKRIAIATVLSMRPQILLLDEPTSNLDPAGRWHLIELLRQLPVTKVVASHDLGMVAQLCPRTIIMSEGRAVSDGPTAEIISDVPLLQAHGLSPIP